MNCPVSCKRCGRIFFFVMLVCVPYLRTSPIQAAQTYSSNFNVSHISLHLMTMASGSNATSPSLSPSAHLSYSDFEIAIKAFLTQTQRHLPWTCVDYQVNAFTFSFSMVCMIPCGVPLYSGITNQFLLHG